MNFRRFVVIFTTFLFNLYFWYCLFARIAWVSTHGRAKLLGAWRPYK